MGLRAEPVRPGAGEVAHGPADLHQLPPRRLRGYAGRLQGDLSRRYTEEHVFRDVEIPPGADFGEYITGLVDKCNVVLAIIGPRWLDARDREGERRIDDPQDWVRLEIERALARDGVEVIPALVDGARLPPREELLPSLLGLRRRNAFELSDSRWDYDLDQLGKHLDVLLHGTSAIHRSPTGPRPTPAEVQTPAPAPAPAPEPADHTTGAVLAAAAVALLTAFPADLIARNLVDRAALDRDDLVTVRDFVLEKAIFFGIVGALAALAVGFLSPWRSREPVVSTLLGLGAGVVAGAAYAGSYAGLTLSSAEGTEHREHRRGHDRRRRLPGLGLRRRAVGLAHGGLVCRAGRRADRRRDRRPLTRFAHHAGRPPPARGPVRRGDRRGRRLRRPARPARVDRARRRAAHARSSSATGHAPRAPGASPRARRRPRSRRRAPARRPAPRPLAHTRTRPGRRRSARSCRRTPRGAARAAPARGG